MAFWNRTAKPKRSPALLASSAPLSEDRKSGNKPEKYQTWQDEAWAAYDGLGEFRQGVKWLSNVISRARLIPATAPTTPGDEPASIDADTGDPAVDLVESIAHGIGGQAELLRSCAVHLTVPGEGWFVGDNSHPEVAWKFYSRDEVRVRNVEGGRQVQVRVGESDWFPLPPESLPVRVWRPHDRWHWKADSSTRAALPIMRRLELLNRRVDAQVRSRLANNGLYWVPSEMDFPAKEGYEDADDPFIAELMDTASIAIQTPGSAAAAMPMFLRASADYIEKLRHDTFESDDPNLREDREFEIRRLATAIDVPPEVLLGMVGLNHWGAWQVEESALKTTVTNLLELICWSLTTGYLRPALAAMRDMPFNGDIPDLDGDRLVWYDLSELAVRPDRSTNALTLSERLMVNEEATLRETGFDQADALTDPDELRHRIGLMLIRQASTVQVGLEMLGISTVAQPVLTPTDETGLAEPVAPRGEGEMPANDDDRTTPDTEPAEPVEPPEFVPAG